jgi:uncharacterized protein YegJ (DUF2314 family)
MRAPALALIFAAMLLPLAAQAQKQTRKGGAETEAVPAAGDGVYYVRSGDPALQGAIAEGRRTLPGFFTHLANPAPGEHSFMVKYDLLPEPDKAEYIWADVISHTPGVTIARLANDPLDSRFKRGDKVTITDDEILDWGYFRDGVMQGNFTTRAMLPRFCEPEASRIRKAMGW